MNFQGDDLLSYGEGEYVENPPLDRTSIHALLLGRLFTCSLVTLILMLQVEKLRFWFVYKQD